MGLLRPMIIVPNDVLFPIFEVLKRESLLSWQQIVCDLTIARGTRLAYLRIEPIVSHVHLGSFGSSRDSLALGNISHSNGVGIIFSRIFDLNRNFSLTVKLLCKQLR